MESARALNKIVKITALIIIIMSHGEVLRDNRNFFGGWGYDFNNQAALFVYISASKMYV